MTKKVPKSTQKYRKILKITHKYHKVPKSTKMYTKVHKCKGGPQFFFSQGVPQNYSKGPKKYPKKLKSTEKYSKLLISTLKYQKVPKSTQKYIKVKWDHRFFFTGGTTKVAKNTQNDQKSTKKY